MRTPIRREGQGKATGGTVTVQPSGWDPIGNEEQRRDVQGGAEAPAAIRRRAVDPNAFGPRAAAPKAANTAASIEIPDAPAAPQAPGAIWRSRDQDVAPVEREGVRLGGFGQGKEDLPGVSGRLRALLDANSPYMTAARERSQRQAARRGLQSSSIAAGAGEVAAIEAALPIASADAGLAQAERQMRSTEFLQARDHRVQQIMQIRGLSHDAAQAQANRESQQFMQARDHRVQQLMQKRGLSHAEAMQASQHEQQRYLQHEDHRVQQLMQERGFSHEEAMQISQQENQRYLQRQDHRVQQLMQERGLTHEAAQREADRENQRHLQSEDHRVQQIMQEKGLSHEAAQNELSRENQRIMQERDNHVRQIMQQRDLSLEEAQREADRAQKGRIARDVSIRDINKRYADQISRLDVNKDLPPEVRQEREEQAAWLRDQELSFTASIYETTDATWESAAAE